MGGVDGVWMGQDVTWSTESGYSFKWSLKELITSLTSILGVLVFRKQKSHNYCTHSF